ncbi:hypothetical protein RvY_16021 [Ramazzottius varieornatus]|uniref:K Homology domain-containing protein n=1 Tax=Ramazzottius varieornatus TaxID=947166 RepID=A0A1D1VWY9_RAMVA|nr:hypothetical protein RvY_16021 [Ramazzottius varieornatus]
MTDFAEALKKAKEIAKALAEQGKRSFPEEDGGGGTPAKRFSAGPPGMPGMNGAFNMPNGQTQEEWTVPNRMVGLIIGKGGENISRIQDTCGAKLQLGQEPVGDKRPCTIYGNPQAIQKCKEMVNEIIEKEGQRNQPFPGSFPGPGASPAGGGFGGPGGHQGGHPGLGAQSITIEVHVPRHKVGQVIGKGGETIRSLQDKTRVRMFLIQDVDPSMSTKPIKITGEPARVEEARRLVEEMIATPDGPGPGSERGMQVQDQVKVPRERVGVIIGKGGETIRDIQNETGARVQFVDLDQPHLEEKTCLISGRQGQVVEAKRMVEDLLRNALMMNQQKPIRQYEVEEIYKVPAAKTGIIIGKGGETIRMINERSGARVELDRNYPQTAEDRAFWVRGSRECVEAAKRMIEEKMQEQPRGPGGHYGGGGGGGGGHHQQGGGSWDGGHGGGGNHYWDPNAANSSDPSAAFWSAYCQQYYQMAAMGGMPAQPAMANAYMPAVPAMSQPISAEPAGAPGTTNGADATSASYYYNTANTPQADATQAAATVTTSADGQQDYSRAWIEYYRSVGQHKEADDLEATLKTRENGDASSSSSQ